MITIIVPVWNAASTLFRCVESIHAQTYSDWELLLSDDGSQDESLQICQELAEKDLRIHVISNTHCGVAHTRNAALDVAKGEYICYVDADDSIDPDYLEVLYAHHNYDMVVCGYWVDIYGQDGTLKTQTKNVQPESAYNFDHKEKMKALFASGAMHINCNKLLRKDIIDQHHLRYKSYPVNEDFIFMMEYLLHCKSLYVVEKATYHWIRVENQQSGVESIPDNLIEIYNEAHELLRMFFDPDIKVSDEIMYYSYELVALKYLRAIKRGFLSKPKGDDKLKSFHNNNWVKKSFSAYHPKSLGEGLYYWLLRLGLYRIYSAFVIKTN